MSNQDKQPAQPAHPGWLQRLRQRGVLRVALSYALIAWLLLQIGDVVLEPLGAPGWVMRALIVVVIAGFPIALLLAWFFELTPSGIERDALPEGVARPAVRGLRHYADVLVIGVLAIAVVFLLARQQGWIEEEHGQPVVGVLPFTELGAGENAYFGDGLADTLTYKLGLLKQLIVLAPSSTFEFRGPGLDLKAVGAKLGATALLEGTVQRAGGLLRINARLVDVASGQQLWSGSYDRSGADVFAVQDEIAGAATEALQVILSPEDQTRLEQPMTSSLTAYDAYLLGREKLAQRDYDTINQSIDYFRKAINLDPDYALAHAALAEAIYLTNAMQSWARDWSQFGPEARQAAATALALDPNLGEAYLAQGLAAMGDNDFGEKDTWPEEHIRALFKRAVELSPNNAQALKFYAGSLPPTATREKLELLQHAAQLDPRSGIIKLNVAEQYFDLGDFEQGRHWYVRAASVSDPPFMLAYKVLIEDTVFGAQQLDVAARWGRALLAAFPDSWWIQIAYGRALLQLGAWDELHAMLDSLPTLDVEPADDSSLYMRTYIGAQLAVAEDELETAGELAATFSRLYFEPLPSWPDLTRVSGSLKMILDIQAFADIRQGHPRRALDRYLALLPTTESRSPSRPGDLGTALVTPGVVAVLRRMTGDAETAEQELRNYLGQIADAPLRGDGGVGFGRFTVLALLGETDMAIDELQKVVDSGWLPGWWQLKIGAFDPSYAAVVADPRFAKLYAEIEGRVRRMRESFLEHPELPAGQRIR